MRGGATVGRRHGYSHGMQDFSTMCGMDHLALLALMMFFAAVLYSSIGHAGASAYLAAMALLSVPPEVMKPTALCLNIIVATIGTMEFARAGYFSWRVY